MSMSSSNGLILKDTSIIVIEVTNFLGPVYIKLFNTHCYSFSKNKNASDYKGSFHLSSYVSNGLLNDVAKSCLE